MSYAPTHLDGRGPSEYVYESHRPAWASSYQATNPRAYPAPSTYAASSAIVPSDVMDPETSDSDVSIVPGDHPRTGSSAAVPATLPPPPPRQALESSGGVQDRLRELSQVEDHNIRKQDVLAAKRRRKDERVARKREVQDRKMKAIMDARQRRDSRIISRRSREDAAFRMIDQQIEEEETNLRRRLKRLKRGLPADESPQQAGRSISGASMSPPGPAYSTIPPPAKRHQIGPPGQPDGTPTYQPAGLPLPPRQTPSAPSAPSAPSYSFYQANQQPHAVPYHSGPAYSTIPSHHASTNSGNPPPSQHGVHDRPPYAINGRPASPFRPAQAASTQEHTPPIMSVARQPSSTYDTKPPPATSGFASINAPPSSGFAAINARSAETPPSAYSSLAKPAEIDTRTPSYQDSNTESAEIRKNGSTSENATPGSASGGGKRTPSTTHPYQMSEAFANRHHHCENTDALQRGIWTSFGPGGTQDMPTGPPVKMYLRCNHDDCQRIDWRTVHGLQCHIVKNHEQPKGTIGSLEKALDRYGVPVSEVEDYERDHGEGTGGTMADPKNLKIRNKTREAARKSTPASYAVDPTARPAGYKPSPPSANSPQIGSSTIRSFSAGAGRRGYLQADVDRSDTDDSAREAPTPATQVPVHNSEAIKSDWKPHQIYKVVQEAPGRSFLPAAVDPNRQLQGDAVMKDAPPPRPEFTPTWRYWTGPNSASATSPITTVPQPSKPTFDTSRGSSWSTIPSARPAQSPAIPSSKPQLTGNNNENADRSSQRDKNAVMPFNNSKDTDVRTTGVEQAHAKPQAEKRKDTGTDGIVETKLQSPATQPIAAEIDGEATNTDAKDSKTTDAEAKDSAASIAGPASGTRSAMQSPVITNKPFQPGSAKRNSRRSSTARKLSGDSADDQTQYGRTDGVDSNRNAHSQDKTSDKAKEAETDGDTVQVAAAPLSAGPKKEKDEVMKESLREKELAQSRTPPRRNASGRFTSRRKNTYGAAP